MNHNPAMKTSNHSRRNFLKTAGCITISFPLLGGYWSAAGETTLVGNVLPRNIGDESKISAWLKVLDDGRVRVFTGKLELGQGIRTAIAQVAAEELDMDLDQVEVMLADTHQTPNEGYTAGSGSIERSAMSVRYAAASARQKLLELGAVKLNTKPENLTVKKGRVSNPQDNHSLTFAEILEGRQLEDEIQQSVSLKPTENYQYVGKPIPRQDIEMMVRGEPLFVQDLRFPGMVHARVVHPKSYQAKLLKFDEAALKRAVPGVIKTIVNGSFLAVLASDEYQAVRAQAYLQQNATWSDASPLPVGQDMEQYLRSLPLRSENVIETGNFAEMENASGGLLKASYSKPYIMHGAIGPSCAVALYENEKLEIWSHSQGVYPLRESIQKLLNLDLSNIHIKGVPGAGCYGHNGADDVAAEAAIIAMAYPGRHIRLQWARHDEHGWEPYGSAMQMEAEASLDSSGKIQYWQYTVWSDTHSTRPGGDPANLLVAHYLEKSMRIDSEGYTGGGYRNAEPYYTIPNVKVNARFFNGPLRVSSLRSLGAYANIFAIESFMDELAEKAGKDPLAFRLAHTEDERSVAVIQKLQELTQNEPTAENEGIGYAFSRYKNSASYCAVAAKVQVNTTSGEVGVQKMWASIDAGQVINLDGIKNQTEGGMVQAASWTLMEEVKFDEQHVNSLDWESYPVFRFNQIPEVEVAVIDRPDLPPLGAGEAAQAPTGAAVANAVYKACGKRVRHLPIRPEKIRT